MQFVSLKFLIFLFLTISIYFVLPKKVRYIWLLGASWAFYYKVSGKLLLLLVTVSVVAYLGGRLMEGKNKKVVLITSVTLLVLILGYFKYTGFLLETVDSLWQT